MYITLLTVHLLGALATAFISAYGAVVLLRGLSQQYRVCASALGIIAGFEVLSGVALAITSANVTALSLCSNIAVYLSLVSILEIFLFLRMKKVSLVFPLERVLVPITTSLGILIASIAYGF